MSIVAIACHHGGTDRRGNNSISKATIKYVDWDIETPIRIDCSSLQTYFGDRVVSHSIDDSLFLDSLATTLTTLKPSPEGYMPDVRLVIEGSFADGTKILLGMSDIAIEVNGKPMTFQPSLFNLVQRWILRHS